MCDFYYGYCLADCPFDGTSECPFFESDFDDDVFTFEQISIWELI